MNVLSRIFGFFVRGDTHKPQKAVPEKPKERTAFLSIAHDERLLTEIGGFIERQGGAYNLLILSPVGCGDEGYGFGLNITLPDNWPEQEFMAKLQGMIEGWRLGQRPELEC